MRIRTRVEKTVGRLVRLLLAACLIPALGSVVFAGEGWWNEDFQYRKKITLDTTPSGADIQSNLSEVPVLVRLHPGNMNFTNALENGEDIRFVMADDKTVLSHHLDSYDGLGEIGAAWVRLPRVSGNSGLDYLWMYYGNKKAMGGGDARGTFGSDAAVFHFTESRGLPADSSMLSVPVDRFSGGQGLPGVIGNGLSFNGLSDQMVIRSHPSLDMSGGFTVSAWVKIPTFLEDAVLFERKGDQADLVIAIAQAELYCTVTLADGRVISTEKTAGLSPGSWHPVAVTGSPDGVIAIHVDGIRIDWVNLNQKLPVFNGDMAVGASLEGDRFFTGELDELRLYSTALSADRIRLDFAIQGQDRPCLSLGEEMMNEGGGSPIFYLGTVFKNITLDGWLIIVILMVLGVMSGAVIVIKGITFHMMTKENRFFRSATSSRDDSTLFAARAMEGQYGSLLRIYNTGMDILEPWVGKGDTAAPLSSHQIEQFKSGLEKGLIDETVRMNDWMTVLTMSISGGPFLGLLGTVWGVMNTFAAMAEAGEANIMAIAPGVASALSTTVFGLIVAIPALFGYNYLSTRIRQTTIDLNVYVDELTLQVNRMFGGER